MDHYQTLGVAKDATADQIKAAYRRLARKYHPDVSRESDAQDKIKAINEAYSVLGDKEKRRQYDRRGAGNSHAAFDDGEIFGGGFHDLFESLFQRTGRGRGVYALTITIEQAYQGGTLALSINAAEVSVNIPAGTREGDRLSSIDGQWHFQVQYAPHARFQVEGGHIIGTVKLTAWEMALGGKHPVDTLGGKVQATLPEGLQPGQRIRLAGRGMPANKQRKAGDHWAQVVAEVPKPTTTAQRKAYEALRDSFKR